MASRAERFRVGQVEWRMLVAAPPDAPLGQRTRGAFRRAPLILWTPLTPDEKGAARPFQTPKQKGSIQKS